MTTIHYGVARSFTTLPGPRYKRQGPKSGEAFREIVVKLLKDYENVVIDLDGVEGYGSSFLDEAFPQLVTKEGYSPAELHKRLRFSWSDKLELKRLWDWIDHARYREDA